MTTQDVIASGSPDPDTVKLVEALGAQGEGGAGNAPSGPFVRVHRRHRRHAWADDEQLVQWLLDAGADTTIADKTHHSTPAGWAPHFGHHALADRIESFPKGSER